MVEEAAVHYRQDWLEYQAKGAGATLEVNRRMAVAVGRMHGCCGLAVDGTVGPVGGGGRGHGGLAGPKGRNLMRAPRERRS